MAGYARSRPSAPARPQLRQAPIAATVLAAVLALSQSMVSVSAAADFPAQDSDYHSYPEMVDAIRAIEADHPGIVRVFSIGESHKSRKIWTVEISDNVGEGEGEPEVLFDGLHHAREHLTGEMALYTIRLLANNYGAKTSLGRRVTKLVDSRRIWVIPVVNPDGVQYDLAGDAYRSWRKNRQPIPGSNAIGTDLNRNYDYQWSQGDDTPSHHDYHGPRPWSAPEVSAIRDFVLSRRTGGVQRIRAHVSFHSAGELVLWPYGYTHTNVPADMTELDHRALKKLGKAMAIRNGYTAKQSSALYLTFGDQIDWMYGTQRIFSYTFEMYPTQADRSVGRHYPPDELIPRETKRNRDAVLYLLDQADCLYRVLGKAGAYCGPLFDDLEISRGWTVDPRGNDTASAGAWQQGDPTGSRFQLGTATSGRSVLVTGRSSGNDLDGGRTTVRSRAIRLPARRRATLRLRYWVGMSGSATEADRFRVRLVGAGKGRGRAVALSVAGGGGASRPSWRTLSWPIPASLRGEDVAIELLAVDGDGDATIEAGVDDVRITLDAE